MYTCSAQETASYELPFAVDTADLVYEFTFDQSRGWVLDGQASVRNQKTTWTLPGKVYTMDESGDVLDIADRTSTLEFGEVDENGVVTAHYTYTATPPANMIRYHALSFEGDLTGTLKHEFASETFSVELNDPENGVTLDCDSYSASVLAGTGTVERIRVNFYSNSTYRENNDTVYRSTGLIYNEVA